MNKTIFITGASGFVGAHISYYLIEKNCNVIALKQKSTDLSQIKNIFLHYNKTANNLFEKIRWIEGDVLDYIGIETAISNVDHVIHCAAMVSFNKKKSMAMMKVNIKGTANIVNACLKQKVKLCHISSIAALGTPKNNDFITEDSEWDESIKKTDYSKSKYFSELEVWRGISEGLDAVILNPSVILGYSNWDKGTSAIFSKIWNGFNYYTEGSTGFVDVKDLSKITYEVLNNNIEKTNYIVSAGNFSYYAFLSKIAESLNKPSPNKKISKKKAYLVGYVSEIISKITGKEPSITRDLAISTNKNLSYTSNKLHKAINFQFNSVSKTIEEIAECFTIEHNTEN